MTSDTILTKDDASTSDDQIEKLTREFNIHYRSCISSLIYLLFTRVYLSFSVYKFSWFSSNPCPAHFERLVNLFRYIRDNNTLGLNYYAEMKYAPLSELLRQTIIKTDNQLMAFSGSRWKYFPDTGICIGEYIIFYQDGSIDHGAHVTVSVVQ